jgi:hypothetical protein
MLLTRLVDPSKTHQADWLPFKGGEVMYTDGIKTTGYIKGNPRNSLSSFITRVLLINSS